MHLTLVGLSHRTAPVQIREKLTFPANRQEEALGLRRAMSRSPETAIVSTCNRTEVYCAGETPEFDPTMEWLARSGGVTAEVLRSHCYTLENGLATRTASLSWPRTGETQITIESSPLATVNRCLSASCPHSQ